MQFLEEAIRPWGKYQKFYQEDGVWVKRVEVNPNCRLSLQKHQHRSEKWVFVAGSGVAIVDSKEIPVSAGSVVDIPLGAVHRIGNSGQERFVFRSRPAANIFPKKTLSVFKTIMPADALPSRNFKLTLEYDGKNFCGWQTQIRGLRTAQNHLEEQLEKIFKQKVHVHASGRTDSGVHALGQVAHVKAKTSLTPAVIQKALNSFLEKDISVLQCVEVPLSFHAQNDAKTKIYRYTILNRLFPSALYSDRAFFYPHHLNLQAMRKTARYLDGTHDFKTFQAASSRSRIKNTRRTINIKIVREGDFIHISMTSDGFLYKMVRNIVGLSIAVGSGKLKPEAAVKLLGSKDRRQAPRTAPGHGLYLVSVSY